MPKRRLCASCDDYATPGASRCRRCAKEFSVWMKVDKPLKPILPTGETRGDKQEFERYKLGLIKDI